MRVIEIGPKDGDIVMSIEIRGRDESKAEAIRQAVLSALQQIENREAKPCHGCGDK